MKNTPLTDRHIALGAKMAEFAGYNMPISYKGIKEEHDCVRHNAGIFDVSHMGEFIVKGKQAMDLIQFVTSNDVSKLSIGDAQYSCMPNLSGGIVDDLLVYRLPEDQCAEGERAYMLVVNASNIQKDWDWIQQNNHFDTRIINISEETGLVAIQGPKVAALLQSLTTVDLRSIEYYKFVKGTFAGVENTIISATGYTGAGGFEIYAENQHIPAIWDAVLSVGAKDGLQPIGLGARDTLRLEMGFCLYGNDIDDTTSPLEAGLGWITKIDKGDFNGKEWLLRQKKHGLQRKLVAFVMEDRRVPRHHYEIVDTNGHKIGYVTSGTFSPSLNQSIGLAYVPLTEAKEGNMIRVQMGSKVMEGTIVKLPFYKSH
ncbi:MAG: glycine cleavage system aminomethyltransferase GcvT [Saprospiraceae bacterium]|nr:glycine cleavage system aminomethyltransferase GcvT [Saprospiraceae bacterium]HMW38929.1 glycine cleavage system aminomethyltransferase GcvT [Saprospiraceae bacterium]HMX88109.1 glycine cleavage system aminomethyltransferase GcvT [Saprospiraceae bacterium]HMZ38924.1 glycine cleavage system aminomethyltransferase GcvT [Saprospiraceae bacterium]HNA64685.1 glycine cleavage system aminomethyltransferase GcvT [Saprospiraceae bacterium]